MEMVGRAADFIVGVLASAADTYFGALSIEERNYLARKAEGTRALRYRMGDFDSFSLNVSVVTWEEIGNQRLFLLSL